MDHTLAIITVIYENYTVFDDYVKSLEKQKNKNFHLFVVDVSKTRKPIDFGTISATLIETENKGYADGINTGIKAAQKQELHYFCAMNNDTYFKENFVDTVLNALHMHPDSIIGGKIYYAPGYEYHKDRYSKTELGKVLWFAGGKMDWGHALTPHIGVDEVDKGQYDDLRQVDFITGCLMCFDETVVKKVGYWDPNYFLYYEDADYSARAVRKGVKLYYDPSIVLWHKVAQTTHGSGSSFHQKYQDKNRVVFGLKYAPVRTKLHLLKNFFLEKINTR